MDHQAYLDYFLSDVCCNNCLIHSFIGDNPKRAIARASKSHSSYFPCEYCEAHGQLLHNEDKSIRNRKTALIKQKEHILNKLATARENDIEEEVRALMSVLESVNDAMKILNRKNNNIVWPSSSSNGSPRTTEKVLEITEKIENDDILSNEESKGIVGRSLFLDIPYFNYVLDIPTEYLHNTCLGSVKRLVELTFNVGETRQRNTTRKLSSVSTFNAFMRFIQVVREFSRRARNLDFSVMKGQEFRNLALFFFPIILKCIEEPAKERRLWLLLAYIVRLGVLPDEEFQNVDPSVLAYCEHHYYKLYEHLFGARNCSYNTHVFGSHMDKMRAHGPLTMTSAFGFESFYSEMRHSFTPGTASPLKQILEKVLIKRSISPHCCKATIFYSPKETPYESNSLIYTFHNNNYSFFKIMSIEENSMECFKVGKYEASFQETPTLNWGKVGVFSTGGISPETVTVQSNDIAGKVIRVNDLFITCPLNVLEEK